MVHIATKCILPQHKIRNGCCIEVLSTRTPANYNMQKGSVLSHSPDVTGNASGKMQVLTRRQS